MFTTLIFVLSITVCFGYIAWTKIRQPDLPSISNTYYRGYPFLMWCWFTGMTLLPAWLEMSPENLKFLAFMSFGGLWGLGTVPKYLEDESAKHFAAAFVFGFLAVLWMCLDGLWIPASITVAAMLGSYFRSLWLAETVGLVGLYATLAYELFW